MSILPNGAGSALPCLAQRTGNPETIANKDGGDNLATASDRLQPARSASQKPPGCSTGCPMVHQPCSLPGSAMGHSTWVASAQASSMALATVIWCSDGKQARAEICFGGDAGVAHRSVLHLIGAEVR